MLYVELKIENGKQEKPDSHIIGEKYTKKINNKNMKIGKYFLFFPYRTHPKIKHNP